MKHHKTDLITDLIKRTKLVLAEAKALMDKNIEQLNQRSSETAWSALECIEHLNRYGAFYIPEITSVIENKLPSNNQEFKSSWLGNYFALSMLPKENLNKMNTFKSMNPIGSKLDKKALTTFIGQQNELLELLESSKNLDLTKLKTAISISKLIKLSLGDTFRVVIYHNQRHIEQAKAASQ